MSTVRRKAEMSVELKGLFGGPGEGELRKILLGAEEMYGKGRLFNHMVYKPGCGLGWHVHNGDGEIYYILRGTAEYNDNGNITTVTAGDTTIVNSGEGHSILNIGDEELEFIALVLYE